MSLRGEESVEGRRVDSAEGIIEGERRAGAKEGSDGGHELRGIGIGGSLRRVVGESGGSDVSDVAK